MLFSIFSVTVLTAFPACSGEIDAATIITVHNKWRAKVGVTEKLSYSPTLAMTAQAWADNLKHNNHCRMQHSKPDGNYGENLFWASARKSSDGSKDFQKVSPEKVVNSWTSEKVDFDYAKNRCKPGKMCGHYTQVVWRSTTTVGCGMAVCEDSQEQVWVCQYQPAGNWIGRKPY
ncbi:CAP domain-containing protein [Candidatus Nitrotoga arctica]|uniref:Cysteine-rich secretory protein family protein n=1 Tax=Candidatus Nitrotoga arctica TaxID=453162 RepID=A0ABN8ARU7_9PROT|nr:CAP domain-containing protein [Candidatus Nitrotoga arctica]CAG9933157.1 Cysteine-rich secretory protein family protein [Candidatus Nitrotoga arctica]